MNELQHISRDQIDFARWDECVMQFSPVPYSLSWYLDITTHKKWEALVYGDYEAVLPLPFNKKIVGFKQLYRPLFCQHFNVCGKDVSDALVRSFLKKLPNLYRRVNYPVQVLSKERLRDLGMEVDERTNLLIKLAKPFEEVESSFSKTLRQRMRSASKKLPVDKVDDSNKVVDFCRKQLSSKVGFQPREYAMAYTLFKACQERNIIQMYQIRNEEEDPLAMAIFLDFNGRLINILAASSPEGRQQYAMHTILNHVIRVNCETHRLFDFEGSDLMGVKEFFQSFGAEYQPYFTLSANNLPPVIKELFEWYKR